MIDLLVTLGLAFLGLCAIAWIAVGLLWIAIYVFAGTASVLEGIFGSTRRIGDWWYHYWETH